MGRRNSIAPTIAIMFIILSASTAGIAYAFLGQTTTLTSSTSTITTTSCSGTLTIYQIASPPCTTITTTTTGISGCPSCLIAPPAFINNLVNYFVNFWNPNVGMIAVGTANGNGGVNFCYPSSPSDCNNGGGTYCGLVPFNQKFLPFESWKDAAAFQGLGIQTGIASKIFSTIQGLETTVNWIPPNNLEASLGYITSYRIQNTNICFTATGSAPSPSVNGFSYQIDQAAAWNYGSQSYKQPDMNSQDGRNSGTANINIIAQAFNFYLRGDLPDAQANLQYVANTCSLNSDGSANFDRPMTMGMFLEAVEVMGAPNNLPNGCSISNIAKTLIALQNPDGGIASSYSCAFASGCNMGGSTDENSNAALDAFSPGLIIHVQQVAASKIYNLNSVPSYSPTIGI